MNKCIHCIVRGRVQGVFYRASTRDKAVQHGLIGWVRNLPDGSVEVEACGSTEQIGKLHEWLWNGPNGANVTEVSCKETRVKSFDGEFSIRY